MERRRPPRQHARVRRQPCLLNPTGPTESRGPDIVRRLNGLTIPLTVSVFASIVIDYASWGDDVDRAAVVA
jgi:hypothetical protein